MRRALAVLVLVALALLPAGAADDPTNPDLKRHILSSRAVVGDWSTYEATLRSIPGDKPRAPVRFFVTYRVKEVTNTGFVIQTETEPFHSPAWPTHAIPRDSEKLRDLLQLGPEVVISDVSAQNEGKTILDREFPCRRIEFTTTEGTLIQQNVLWFAGEGLHDFGGVRLIALTCRPVSGAQRPLALELELRGHGRGGKTQWGATAKELAVK
ncbi:MAG: hypothetical protein ACAI25_19090 [Planctomycetota bacterium]